MYASQYNHDCTRCERNYKFVTYKAHYKNRSVIMYVITKAGLQHAIAVYA